MVVVVMVNYLCVFKQYYLPRFGGNWHRRERGMLATVVYQHIDEKGGLFSSFQFEMINYLCVCLNDYIFPAEKLAAEGEGAGEGAACGLFYVVFFGRRLLASERMDASA